MIHYAKNLYPLKPLAIKLIRLSIITFLIFLLLAALGVDAAIELGDFIDIHSGNSIAEGHHYPGEHGWWEDIKKDPYLLLGLGPVGLAGLNRKRFKG